MSTVRGEGHFAEQLAAGLFPTAREKDRALLNAGSGGKRSEFFKNQRLDWRAVRGNEIGRSAELLRQMKILRKDGEAAYPERTYDLTSVAIRLGFASEAALKKACATVLGKTIAAVERVLAREVATYYLCAEEKVLRELASREGESGVASRARYLYSGDEEYVPAAPFLDLWSAMECARAEWLEGMGAAFG